MTVVYDGGDKSSASSFEYFFDGVQLTSTAVSAGPTGELPNGNLLGGDNGSDTSFQGLMDNIEIFDTALSNSEIQDLASEWPATSTPATVTIAVEPDVSYATVTAAGSAPVTDAPTITPPNGGETFSFKGPGGVLVANEIGPFGGSASIDASTGVINYSNPTIAPDVVGQYSLHCRGY